MKTAKIVFLLLIIFSIALSAKPVFEKKDIINSLKQNSTKSASAACVEKKHNNFYAGYASGQAPHDRIVTYFEFDNCDSPAFPFEFQSMSFFLRDMPLVQWPVRMDIVVFAPNISGDKSSGPGDELFRYEVTCDYLNFAGPEIGNVELSEPLCINEPVYIGLEYAGTGESPFPSLPFDTNSIPTVDDNWYYFDIDTLDEADKWIEWYDFWDVLPGYPLFWIYGESDSPNCTLDSDGDGIDDDVDNCQYTYNPDQLDDDFDGVGDLCDNCTTFANSDQTDTDLDGIGNACDECPDDYNNDRDGDGLCEASDNCPGTYNPDQIDSNSDGRGDACENCCIGTRGNVDDDPGELVDVSDLVFMIDYMLRTPTGPMPDCFEEADIDASGVLEIDDLVMMVDYQFRGGVAPEPCF